jgi:Domain of Unknown Function (DUF1080)
MPTTQRATAICRGGLLAFALLSMTPMIPSATASAQRAGEWISLFDGKTTAGWRGYKKATIPSGWAVVDGALTRVGQGGDIVTEREFGDFELELEWKVPEAGNSGIFYRATESTDRIFENATEMQVLDNVKHPDNKTPLTLAGANYGLYPAPADAAKPVGEWNQVRIVARGAHVEHWLNGKKVVEYELWSADWKARVAKSKFAQWPSYGLARAGRIGLQDHGDRVAFRNIRIKPLS